MNFVAEQQLGHVSHINPLLNSLINFIQVLFALKNDNKPSISTFSLACEFLSNWNWRGWIIEIQVTIAFENCQQSIHIHLSFQFSANGKFPILMQFNAVIHKISKNLISHLLFITIIHCYMIIVILYLIKYYIYMQMANEKWRHVTRGKWQLQLRHRHVTQNCLCGRFE